NYINQMIAYTACQPLIHRNIESRALICNLWLNALHRTLPRLIMYIKMEVDSNCTFHNFLVTFDDLSRQDTYLLYKDLIHGCILLRSYCYQKSHYFDSQI